MLLHGLAGTPKEFGLLAHPLRRRGITLHAPEIRGYSHATLPRRSRWQDWVDAAGEAVDTIAARHGPLVLGGLCTGAMLALGLGARGATPSVRGLALLSPLVAYDGWALPWWYRFRSLAYLLGLEERFSMRERPPYGLKNERLRQWVRQQMAGADATLVGPPRVSLQVVRESERISRNARAWLARLSLPTMVLHARDDEICSLASVEAALSDAPGELLQMAVLENSYHMITADNDRQQVADRLAAHATACLVANLRPLAAAAA